MRFSNLLRHVLPSPSWLSERKVFLERSLLPLAVTGSVIAGLAYAIEANVRIGWDPQGRSCLPWVFYVYGTVDDVEVPARGQLVRVRLPKTGPGTLPDGFREEFARGLPGGGAKIVVGMPGDRVRIKSNMLIVNNQPWGWLWLLPTLKLASGSLDTDYIIPDGHYLVLGTEPESYDGRYWGVLPQRDILGSIHVVL